MRRIPLSGKKGRGLFALVDDEDYERVMAFRRRWSLHNKGYAQASTPKVLRTANPALPKHTRMHRLVLLPPSGMVVDHRNHDRLDNRRSNLRLCTPQENQRNQHDSRGGTSLYRGVFLYSKSARRSRWRASIGINGQTVYLGFYDTEVDAARAYNHAALKHFGEFACLNTLPCDSHPEIISPRLNRGEHHLMGNPPMQDVNTREPEG